MISFSFTYDKTTPESAEQGDTSDHGFYGPGGWFYSMLNPKTAADIRANPKDYRIAWKLGELKHAIKSARNLGISENSGNWFSSVDPDMDYRTGEETRYSFHVDGVTPSTYRRIARLLGCRQ